MNEGVIEQSVARLIEEGRLEVRRGAKMVLDDTVATLRNEGLTNGEIALRLHEKKSTIVSSVMRLLALGLIEERELIYQGKPKGEVKQKFDTDIAKQKNKKMVDKKQTRKQPETIDDSFTQPSTVKEMGSAIKKKKEIPEKEKIMEGIHGAEIDTETQGSHDVLQPSNFDSFETTVSANNSAHETFSVEAPDKVNVQSEHLEKNRSVRSEESSRETAPSKKKIQQFDAEIKALKGLGFQDREIMDMFHIELWMLRASIKRLKQAGMIEIVNNARESERLRILDKKVKPLIAQGLDTDAIVQRISESVDEVQKSMFRIGIRKKNKK